MQARGVRIFGYQIICFYSIWLIFFENAPSYWPTLIMQLGSVTLEKVAQNWTDGIDLIRHDLGRAICWMNIKYWPSRYIQIFIRKKFSRFGIFSPNFCLDLFEREGKVIFRMRGVGACFLFDCHIEEYVSFAQIPLDECRRSFIIPSIDITSES